MNYRMVPLAIICLSLILSAHPPGQLKPPNADVIYIPTPDEVVEAMLEFAQVKSTDVVYDLGSGDGRIPIYAAQKYGARGVGVEINPILVQEANENAKQAGVANRVRFVQQDMFQADITEATVVTLFLLESLNERLRPKLQAELGHGARIVSHEFRMGEWAPEKSIEVIRRMIHLWTVRKP